MSTILEYALSEAAQRAELAAGRDGARDRTIKIDLAPYLGETEWVQIDAGGRLTASRLRRQNNSLEAPQAAVLTDPLAAAEMLAAECRAERAARATREAERLLSEAAIHARDVAVLRQALAAGRIYGSCGVYARVGERQSVSDYRISEYPEIADALRAEIARRDAERAAERAAEQAAEQAAAVRLTAQVSAWVAIQGDESQRARLAAGLLPRTEVEEMIRLQEVERVRAAAGGLTDYAPIASRDLEHDQSCETTESLTGSTTDLADCPAAAWAAYSALHAALPGCEVTVRRHDYQCAADECGGALTRLSIRACWQIGEIACRLEVGV